MWWGYAVAGLDPFPSPADLVFLLGYVPLAFAAAKLASAGQRDRDRSTWIDAAILTLVVGLLIWAAIVKPYVEDPSISVPGMAISIGYPIADLIVFGFVLRLVLVRAARNRGVMFFATGVLATLCADVIFAWQDLGGTFQTAGWVDSLWLVGYLGMSAACVTSSLTRLDGAVDDERIGRGRLGAIMLAVLVPQLVVLSELHEFGLVGSDTVTIAVGVSMITMTLVAARLWSLLGRAQRVEARRGEERLAALIHHSTDAIFLVDADARIGFASPAATELWAHHAEACLGASLLDAFAKDDRAAIASQLDSLASMPLGAVVPIEGRIPIDGELVLVFEGTGSNLLDDENVRAIVVTLRDTTSRRELEEQLQRRAFYDDLTGIANRALFADRVAHGARRPWPPRRSPNRRAVR